MQQEDASAPVAADELRERDAAQRLEQLSVWLDSAFTIPGTRWRVGWDVLLGLVPVAGDALSLAVSGYVLWLARQAGAPPQLRVRMLTHVAVDFLIGLVPGIGDLLDVANRANLRNARLLEGWLREQEAKRNRGTERPGFRAELLLALVLVVALLACLGMWNLLQ